MAKLGLVKGGKGVHIQYERHVDTGQWRVRVETMDGIGYVLKPIFATSRAAEEFVATWAHLNGITLSN
jgi:hypothetical protein